MTNPHFPALRSGPTAGSGACHKSKYLAVKLIYDCLIGDPTLFHRTDVVEAVWKVADPVHDTWASQSRENLPVYAPGSWGPREAGLLHRSKGSVPLTSVGVSFPWRWVNGIKAIGFTSMGFRVSAESVPNSRYWRMFFLSRDHGEIVNGFLKSRPRMCLESSSLRVTSGMP